MSALGAPKVISPLIRFSRYSALLGGIMYGSYRFKYLSAQEKEIQEREDKIRERIRVKKDKEDAIKLKVDMDNLARDIGITPK